jgi:hypothetical protein
VLQTAQVHWRAASAPAYDRSRRTTRRPRSGVPACSSKVTPRAAAALPAADSDTGVEVSQPQLELLSHYRIMCRTAITLLLIGGCRSPRTPPADTVQLRPAIQGPASAVRAARHQDENTRRAALARGSVPGYAGDMREGCNYVVLLTDTLHQAAAARRYFGGRATNCVRPGQLLVRQVRYDFAQLYEWYAGPFTAVWREKGVTSSSIAIQHNRIEVGVRPEATARVQQLLDGLPIPKDAVQIVRGVYGCSGTGGPSVVVRVRDQRGRPAAFGTTIVIQDGAFRDSVDGAHPLSELTVGAGERRPGTYQVRLYKPGYKPVELTNVKAPGDTLCHYATPTDIRDVTLEVLPNAPRVHR